MVHNLILKSQDRLSCCDPSWFKSTWKISVHVDETNYVIISTN